MGSCTVARSPPAARPDWRIADSPDDNMTRLTTGPRTGQGQTAPGTRSARRLAVTDGADGQVEAGTHRGGPCDAYADY